jgi:adenylylsulfate kinase
MTQPTNSPPTSYASPSRKSRNHAPVLWFTGLSGAGKSTIARALHHQLTDQQLSVELLDGDEVRSELSSDLGFSRKDRDIQVQRLGYLARLLSQNGVIVLVSAISPYRQARDEALKGLAHPFEIHVDAPLEVVEARDTKGLYAKARAGLITAMTGIDDPYEAPETPVLRIDTDHSSVEDCVNSLLDLLVTEGVIDVIPA